MDCTKLSGTVDTLEGRDPQRLWWANVNLKKCNKAKCRVLYLGLGNFLYQYRLKDKCIENSPVEDLEVLEDKKNYI